MIAYSLSVVESVDVQSALVLQLSVYADCCFMATWDMLAWHDALPGSRVHSGWVVMDGMAAVAIKTDSKCMPIWAQHQGMMGASSVPVVWVKQQKKRFPFVTVMLYIYSENKHTKCHLRAWQITEIPQYCFSSMIYYIYSCIANRPNIAVQH